MYYEIQNSIKREQVGVGYESDLALRGFRCGGKTHKSLTLYQRDHDMTPMEVHTAQNGTHALYGGRSVRIPNGR